MQLKLCGWVLSIGRVAANDQSGETVGQRLDAVIADGLVAPQLLLWSGGPLDRPASVLIAGRVADVKDPNIRLAPGGERVVAADISCEVVPSTRSGRLYRIVNIGRSAGALEDMVAAMRLDVEMD